MNEADVAFAREVERCLPRVEAWFNALDQAYESGQPEPDWPWPEDYLVKGAPQSVAFLVELRRRRCPQATIEEMMQSLKAEVESTEPTRSDTSDRWDVWS